MGERIHNLKLNTIVSVIYQIALVISGLILPGFFLRYYGSEINGLVSSISQFLSFINICDLGIGAVAASALYKPLAENDMLCVSKIMKYISFFFRIIAVILLLYIATLVMVYPRLITTKYSMIYTGSLIVAMSISQVGQYFIGIPNQILLNADQKSYIQLMINGMTLISNTIISVVIMVLGGSIQFVKLIASMIYILRPFFLEMYVSKHYNLNKKVEIDGKVIPQKFNGVVQHFIYIIYGNTDVVILTLFSSLTNVSIYSIYILVLNSIKSFINSVNNGFLSLFGNMLANNEKEKLRKTFLLYEWGIQTICTVIYTITGISIVPFVLIYTNGVNDTNYRTPVFSIIITIAYAINVIKESMGLLIRAAGHYKQTQNAMIIEALLNLIISIIMVFRLGLVGVAIGTLISAFFYMIYLSFYLTKNIISFDIGVFLKFYIVNIIETLLIVIFSRNISVNEYNIWWWCISVALVSVISIFICLLVQFVFFRENLIIVWKRITGKKESAN